MDTTFTIEEFLCTGDPAIAVQLSGPPILNRIDCITVFRGTTLPIDGELPYGSRFGTITPPDADFDDLVTALRNGESVKLKIYYDRVAAKGVLPATRDVTDMEIIIVVEPLARIASDVSGIRSEVGEDLGMVVKELKKTYALLQERLPPRRRRSESPDPDDSIAPDATDSIPPDALDGKSLRRTDA